MPSSDQNVILQRRYGDSYPITVPGRLLAILSVLLGVVMNVLFVSTLTSSLTVFVVELAVNPETGSKVSLDFIEVQILLSN